MMANTNLANYHETNFAMTFRYNYGLSDVENMYPYERDIYVQMIANHNAKLEKNGG